MLADSLKPRKWGLGEDKHIARVSTLGGEEPPSASPPEYKSIPYLTKSQRLRKLDLQETLCEKQSSQLETSMPSCWPQGFITYHY